MIFLVSCSQTEQPVASAPTAVVAKEMAKTPEMIEFESAFNGVSARMAESAAAKDQETALLVAKCKKYLDFYNIPSDENAKQIDIIRLALRTHIQKVQELNNIKIQ